MKHYIQTSISMSLCGLLLFTLLATSCKQSDEHPTDEHEELVVHEDTITITDEQRERIQVTTDEIKQQNISTPLVLSGRIEVPPQDAARIGAPLGGVVRSISVLEGSQVHRGQTVFTLEHAEFIAIQRDYLTTLSKLEVIESEQKRQQALASEQINAGKILEQINGEVRALRIQRKAQQEQLLLLQIDASKLTVDNITRTVRIASPIDGYVTGIYAVTGEFLTPNDSLADIISLNHLHAELFVFEKDISSLKEGQMFSATLNDSRKTSITGVIHLVGRGVEANRTVRVHGHIDAFKHVILPGTTLTATVAVDPRVSIVVPTSAIINDADGTWIFVQNSENRYVRTRVTRGVAQGSETELIDVSNEMIGRKVVVRGISMLNGAFTGGGAHGH